MSYSGSGGKSIMRGGRSEATKRWYPWMVPTIFVADVVLFVVTMYINNCPDHVVSGRKCFLRGLGRFSFQPIKENPLLGPSSATLLKMGALDITKIVHEHQRWRLVTCMWLHAGVVHLLVNMISLLFIGFQLEREFGFVKIGLLYVISGIGGSLLSALFVQSSISVGASGALFGLLGGMLSELITNWTIYANKCAALSTLIMIIAINLAVGILPHVDNFAHIGGFITGFLLGFILLIRPQFGYVDKKYAPLGYNGPARSKHNTFQYGLWVVAAILLVAGFAGGLIMVFRGVNGNDHCHWCHYLSCVPTSLWNCNPASDTCEILQTGSQVNITCQGSGISQVYILPSTGNTTQYTYDLCSNLCT